MQPYSSIVGIPERSILSLEVSGRERTRPNVPVVLQIHWGCLEEFENLRKQFGEE